MLRELGTRRGPLLPNRSCEVTTASVVAAMRLEVNTLAAPRRCVELDAKTFKAAWSEGRAMSPEQAVENALEGDEVSSA